MMIPRTRHTFSSLAAMSVLGLGLSSCSLLGESAPNEARDAAAPQEEMGEVDGSRTLVAYFSVPETDDPDGMTQDEENSTHVVDGEVYGNTEYVATLMAEGLGADQFRMETAEELPLDHDTLIDLAIDWQDSDARPELQEAIPDIDDYDTFIIGYPIWEYDMPMPMYTFFEQNDFTDKDVYLYTTHDVSGLSGTLETVTTMLPEANVSENTFDISRDDMDDSEADVEEWLDTLA